MKGIFVNRHAQIRSGWKIVAVFIFYIALSVVFGSVLQALALNKYIPVSIYIYAGEIAFIAAVLIGVKWLDEKRPRDIGLISPRRGFRDLAVGFFLGAISMTLIFAVLFTSGRVALADGLFDPRFSYFMWSGLLLYIAVGFAEEMFFRGYCITALQQTGKTWLAVLISSLLFSLAHGSNPNVSVIGLLNIFVVGLLFAYMFVKTGNLWMPIGFHISWNYFQGNIFGFPVSGTKPHGIYNIDGVKGWLWSGGAFGPEGGLLATVLLVLVFVFVWRYPKRESPD